MVSQDAHTAHGKLLRLASGADIEVTVLPLWQELELDGL